MTAAGDDALPLHLRPFVDNCLRLSTQVMQLSVQLSIARRQMAINIEVCRKCLLDDRLTRSSHPGAVAAALAEVALAETEARLKGGEE